MDWYLATTKLKSELKVKQSLLANHQLETFFPTFAPRKTSSPIGLPLFPRYVFVYCELARDIRKIQYTPGVSKLVSFGETYLPVPEDVIECLRDRCDDYDIIRPQGLTPGQRVRVRKGIFDGCEGIIREKRGNRRVQLLLQLAFGSAVKLELNIHEVEPVG